MECIHTLLIGVYLRMTSSN